MNLKLIDHTRMSSFILRYNPTDTHITSKKHIIPVVKKKLKQLLTQKVAVHYDPNPRMRRNRRYYYHDHRHIDPWNSKYQYTMREWGKELNPIKFLHNNDPECLAFLNTLFRLSEEFLSKSPECPIINKEICRTAAPKKFPKSKKKSKKKSNKIEHTQLTPVDSMLFHILSKNF